MTKSYTEHFDERGSAYENAMQRYPHARDDEFLQLIRAAALSHGMTVADVPAGGGYLQRYLPNGTRWLGHEPCASFTNHGSAANDSVPLLPLPWQDATIDCAMSLAGVHHLADKRPLFQELARVLKPQGRLVLSDVAESSAVARFLDEFVGAHNSTGHEGIYLNNTTTHDLSSAGFTVANVEHVDIIWRLASEDELAQFCKQLFDLRDVTDAQVAQAIHDYLGFEQMADQTVGMKWQLTTITADNNERT